MRQILIRKGAKVRAVYCPERGERRQFTRLARRLARLERRAAVAAGVEGVAHGFVCCRSPVTSAQAHVGAAVTVSVDLSGWYDSVRAGQVAAGLRLAGCTETDAESLAAAACRTASVPSPRPDERAPRQGLPSSPAASNLAAVALDQVIVGALSRLDCRTAYTRYADDLTVSVWGDDSRVVVDAILRILTRAVEGMGWSLSERKTKIQRSRAGRRAICGVSVGEYDITAPRRTRRRLRAAEHADGDSDQTRGLREWCRLRPPTGSGVWSAVAAILEGDSCDCEIAADRLADEGKTGLSEWLRECTDEQRRAVLTDARRRVCR